MAKINFNIKKYRQEGDLEHTYSPLKNLVEVDNSIVDFNTDELSIDLNNPLNIECQPSYDGTVNLIINDDTLALLMMMPNVIVTSHQAFLTREALNSIAETTMNNLRDYFDGKELKNEIKM